MHLKSHSALQALHQTPGGHQARHVAIGVDAKRRHIRRGFEFSEKRSIQSRPDRDLIHRGGASAVSIPSAIPSVSPAGIRRTAQPSRPVVLKATSWDRVYRASGRRERR